MKKNIRVVSLLLVYVFVLAGCRKDTEIINQPGSELFVSATSSGSYPKTALQAFALVGGFGNYVSLIKYDVDFYKIVYKTTIRAAR